MIDKRYWDELKRYGYTQKDIDTHAKEIKAFNSLIKKGKIKELRTSVVEFEGQYRKYKNKYLSDVTRDLEYRAISKAVDVDTAYLQSNKKQSFSSLITKIDSMVMRQKTTDAFLLIARQSSDEPRLKKYNGEMLSHAEFVKGNFKGDLTPSKYRDYAEKVAKKNNKGEYNPYGITPLTLFELSNFSGDARVVALLSKMRGSGKLLEAIESGKYRDGIEADSVKMDGYNEITARWLSDIRNIPGGYESLIRAAESDEYINKYLENVGSSIEQVRYELENKVFPPKTKTIGPKEVIEITKKLSDYASELKENEVVYQYLFECNHTFLIRLSISCLSFL